MNESELLERLAKLERFVRAHDAIEAGTLDGDYLDAPEQYTIEWFRWHRDNETRWLGTNAEKLLELYEALFALCVDELKAEAQRVLNKSVRSGKSETRLRRQSG